MTANAGLWRGLRRAIGPEGSGTRAAALEFLAASGLTPEALTLLPLGGPAAAEALHAGTADVGFFVAPLTALWRYDYNNVRPHYSLGNQTPAEARRALEQSEGSAPGALARPETEDYQPQRLSLRTRDDRGQVNRIT